MSDTARRLQSLPRRAIVVAPIRLVLGGLGLAASVAAGAGRAGAALACASSALVLLFAARADRRRHFIQLPDDPPEAAEEAAEDGVSRLALSAVFPSTVGVTALLVAALLFRPMLAAMMAGILAGLGIAALIGAGELVLEERRRGRRLFVERGTVRVVSRRRGMGY